MHIAGVDPGKNGAVVIIESNSHNIISQHRLKDIDDFLMLLMDKQPSLIVIEKAQSYPRQGIASAFNYGREYGRLLGLLDASLIKYVTTAPSAWHRYMQSLWPSIQKDKHAAYAWAKKIWPMETFTPKRCRKPHDGLIDAALLAYYGIHIAMDEV